MESKKPKRIIEGFDSDLKRINENFAAQNPELRLEQFLTFWREKNIDLLFANRFDPRELLESICELNKTLVSILTGDQDHDNQSRAIALYFILCLYVKQPESLRRKIRLTICDVVTIQQFCEQEKQLRSHSDARFAWQHLRNVRAIDFVQDRAMYGPSMLSHRGAIPLDNPELSPTAQDAHKESVKFIEARLEPAMAELQSINSNYERVKELLDLGGVSDATVEFESNGSIRELLDRANGLIDEYKRLDINEI